MKIFKLVILSVFFTGSILAQLDISVYTNKDSYEYGEVIKLYCKITNPADTIFEYLAGTYQSCQAEFSFNDFNSWEHNVCLTAAELLTFEPYHSKIYSWTIDPKISGLPNKEGKQQIIGTYYFNLSDTIYINAPQFLGGQLNVGYREINSEAVKSLKDSLAVTILDSGKIEDRISERWQILGYQIDTLIMQYGQDMLFNYFEKNVLIEYISIKDEAPLNYYPLEIGNKWFYERIELENLLDSSNNFIPTDSFYVEVISDTLMPNSRQYFVLNRQFGLSKFVRTNHLGIYYYNPYDSTDVFTYDYNTNENDHYEIFFGGTGSVTRGKDYTQFIFNDSVKTITFDYDFLVPFTMTFGEHFGPLYRYSSHHEPIRYRIIGCKINGESYGDSILVNILKDSQSIPKDFLLSQNYPNPFNPTTTIKYNILRTSEVKLIVYDILGRAVETLVNKTRNSGNYEVIFDAKNLASGIYYYRLTVGSYVQTKKMILIK